MMDLECDDGSPGSATSLCPPNSDCFDCDPFQQYRTQGCDACVTTGGRYCEKANGEPVCSDPAITTVVPDACSAGGGTPYVSTCTDLCETELSTVQSCLFSAPASCASCIDSAVDDIFQEEDCSVLEDRMCDAIYTGCNCGVCTNELEDYYSCVAAVSAGNCGGISCNQECQDQIDDVEECGTTESCWDCFLERLDDRTTFDGCDDLEAWMCDNVFAPCMSLCTHCLDEVVRMGDCFFDSNENGLPFCTIHCPDLYVDPPEDTDPPTPAPSTPEPISKDKEPETQRASPGSSSSSTAAIAGATVGVVAAIAIVAGLFVLFRRRKPQASSGGGALPQDIHLPAVNEDEPGICYPPPAVAAASRPRGRDPSMGMDTTGSIRSEDDHTHPHHIPQSPGETVSTGWSSSGETSPDHRRSDYGAIRGASARSREPGTYLPDTKDQCRSVVAGGSQESTPPVAVMVEAVPVMPMPSAEEEYDLGEQGTVSTDEGTGRSRRSIDP